MYEGDLLHHPGGSVIGIVSVNDLSVLKGFVQA